MLEDVRFQPEAADRVGLAVRQARLRVATAGVGAAFPVAAALHGRPTVPATEQSGEQGALPEGAAEPMPPLSQALAVLPLFLADDRRMVGVLHDQPAVHRLARPGRPAEPLGPQFADAA